MSFNNLSVANFEPHIPYIREYPQDAQRAELWGCIDKNAPADDDTVLRGSAYYQIAGGEAGLYEDYGVAIELKHPGWLKDNRIGHPHELGRVFHDALLAAGVVVVNHEDCKAISHGDAIGEAEATEGEEFFAIAQQIDPELAADRYSHVLSIKSRMNQTGHPTAKSAKVYSDMRHHPHNHSVVDLARLQPAKVEAKSLVAIWDGDKVFDTEQANQEGNPMYAANMGDGLARLVRILKPIVEVNEELVQAANTVRTATIMSKFICGPDGKPLDIHRVA